MTEEARNLSRKFKYARNGGFIGLCTFLATHIIPLPGYKHVLDWMLKSLESLLGITNNIILGSMYIIGWGVFYCVGFGLGRLIGGLLPAQMYKSGPGSDTPVTFSRATVQQLIAQAEKAIVEGKTQEGVELLRRALRNDPNDPKVADSIYNIAFALHGGAAQRNQEAGGNHLYFSAGFSELDSAILVMELLTDPSYERADVLYQLGMFLDHRCQFERAIAAYKRAIELEPDSPDACDALNNLGILYYNRGRGGLGIKDTSNGEVTVFDPMNNPDFDKAEEAFLNVISVSKKAIARDPNCRSALINSHRLLRDIYTNRLQGTKALEHCLQLYQQAPDDEDAVQWLRQAEKNTGKKLL